MKESDLNIQLQEGEGTTLEYKERLSSSLGRELVAMANTLGGRILLGVRDDGTVAGIGDSNSIRARIQDIARNCNPPIQVWLERVGRVIVVHVQESDTKPVQCSEGFFWRQGAVTQKLRREEIRDLFRKEGAIRFDLSMCPGFRYPEDFDPEKFSTWLALSRISKSGSAEDILCNIEAAEEAAGRVLFRNAGVLFFAGEVRCFFNQAYVTCILFRGSDRTDVLDRKDFAGGVVSDIEESLRFVQRNTRTAYRIQALQREEIPEYPMGALREAITNAAMHRDWFIEGANVFVEIYADRIEIVSPGGLPAGLSTAELGTRSVRRNPLVADLLHRIGFIEKAGTGIGRMRKEARDHGCPAPEFRVDSFFTAVFRPLPATQQVGTKSAPSRHQVLVLRKCVEEQPLRALMALTGRSDRTKFRKQVLGPLLQAGFVEMTSPDKPQSSKQRYRITPLGRGALNRESERSHDD